MERVMRPTPEGVDENGVVADGANGDRVAEIDQWGITLARKNGALDVEIGDWLLAVREHSVHEKTGHGTLIEYVERRLGLAPHSTAERLRVADALQRLAEVRATLQRGGISWSAVRELTRVAVPETEREWLAAANGKRAQEVEQLVAGRRLGDRPTDAPDPRLRKYKVWFEVTAAQLAMWREVVRVMRRDIDSRLTEEECLQLLASERLGGPGDDGRAPYQVAIVRCDDCGRAWQDARGEQVELTPEAAELVACDAQLIGDVGGASHQGEGRGKARARQPTPPALRRQVIRRDRGRCRVPGCTSSVFLNVHHIDLRSERGPNDPMNLITLCGAHHARQHEGLLILEGDASTARFFHADGTEYGCAADPVEIGMMARIFSSLRTMGWKEGETKRALAVVRAQLGRGHTEVELLRAALIALTDGRGVAKAPVKVGRRTSARIASAAESPRRRRSSRRRGSE